MLPYVASVICVAQLMNISPGTQEYACMENHSLLMPASRCWVRFVIIMVFLRQEPLRKCCLVFRRQIFRDRCSVFQRLLVPQITLASLKGPEREVIEYNGPLEYSLKETTFN